MAGVRVQALELLREAGAEEFAPKLREEYWEQHTWEVLQERWRL